MPAKRGPITEADYTVEDRGYETPCHIWQGPVSTQGYARFGRNVLAHAKVYEDAHGKPPPTHTVHHRCEEKLCIRLDHLEAVTRAEHTRLHQKFSDELIEDVRRATGSTRQIAHRYGLSKSHVWHLRRRSTD